MNSNYKFTNSKITGIASTVGDIIINIDDELSYYNNDLKQLIKLKEMIGFGTRSIVSKKVTASDLCLQAAQNLITAMKLSVNDFDGIIFVTQTPDYHMPGNSYVIHKKMCFPENCIAYDLVFGCSGFIKGLFLANMMINTGFNRILLLTGDTLSKIIDVRNRADAPVFGDAGSACIIEKSNNNPSYFCLHADGRGLETMWQPAGGHRLPYSIETKKENIDLKGNVSTLENFYMHGFEVFNFTLTTQPKLLEEILQYANKSKENIDYFILHQANKYIVETIIKKAGIELTKSPCKTFSKYGNQSSASIPTTICEELGEIVATSKKQVILQGFGIGLSWAACQLALDHIICLSPQIYKEVSVRANSF